MNRALPLATLLLAAVSSSARASNYCASHPAAPSCVGQVPTQPTSPPGGGGGGGIGSLCPGPECTMRPGVGVGGGGGPAGGATQVQQQLPQQGLGPNAASNLCAINPVYCQNSNSSAATPAGGSSPQTPPSSSPQANGARAAGANANWSPDDVAKLQGGGGSAGGAETGEQRSAMLAAMLASPRGAATPGQDPFGKGVVADLSGSVGGGALKDRADDLIGSASNKLKLGDFAGALQDALKAIELDPANAAGYLKAAEAFNHLGRFADAEEAAREALKRDPNNAQAWKNLAWALLKQGKYKEALEAALMAVKLKPDMAEAWAIAAFSSEKLHELGNRTAYLQKAALLDARFKQRLDAVSAGGSAYTDDDELIGAAPDQKKGSELPWAPIGGALGLLALAGVGIAAWRRKSAAPRQTLVQLRPPTPAAPRAPRMDAPSGSGLVLGKYEFGQLIGRGGMGEVYEAKDLSLGRSVAVKKMTSGFEELGSQARALFIKEARTVAQLHHPAIVDIYEILENGKDLYLVFEHVKGKTAQQLLAESGRMPLKRAADIIRPVCDALQFAHARAMVHRDLKPANIMLTEQSHVKLMDFGIARSLRDAVETQLGVRAVATAAIGSARTATVVGTPVYMAPEAELGIVCKEGDVYSLGVTLYELVTGRLPFTGGGMAMEKAALGFAKATSVASDLPPAVDALIEGALQPQVEHRLKTPGEFLSLLNAAAR